MTAQEKHQRDSGVLSCVRAIFEKAKELPIYEAVREKLKEAMRENWQDGASWFVRLAAGETRRLLYRRYGPVTHSRCDRILADFELLLMEAILDEKDVPPDPWINLLDEILDLCEASKIQDWHLLFAYVMKEIEGLNEFGFSPDQVDNHVRRRAAEAIQRTLDGWRTYDLDPLSVDYLRFTAKAWIRRGEEKEAKAMSRPTQDKEWVCGWLQRCRSSDNLEIAVFDKTSRESFIDQGNKIAAEKGWRPITKTGGGR